MSQQTIIIADDEAFLAQMLSFNIQKSGHKVFIARDGAELCGMAAKKRPNLIITDYQMPIMNGLTACIQLKQNPITAEIPVLMLTARGHRLSPEELSQTNIRLMMPKPFSVREVIAQVENLLHAAAQPAPLSGGSPT
jgi:two-component system, OmpR family, alkaline phosphatase synthesis response regulator PhoP